MKQLLAQGRYVRVNGASLSCRMPDPVAAPLTKWIRVMIKGTFLVVFMGLGCSMTSLSSHIAGRDLLGSRVAPCNVQCLGHDITDSTSCLRDSVYIRMNQELSMPYSKIFDVFNTTKESIYLYSGLFHADWIRQPYVHQVDEYKQLYTFSLTPLYKNFKKVFQCSSLLDVHYNWNSFIELKPNQYYRLRTKILNSYFSKENNAIKIISPKEAYDALKSPFVSLKNLQIKNATIRIGFYKEISKLCEDKPFTRNEIYNLQMDFTTVSADFVYLGR